MDIMPVLEVINKVAAIRKANILIVIIHFAVGSPRETLQHTRQQEFSYDAPTVAAGAFEA